MDIRYFDLRSIFNPSGEGFVVRVCDGELECLAGNDSSADTSKCLLDNKGNLRVLGDYYCLEILKINRPKQKPLFNDYTGNILLLPAPASFLPQNIPGAR